MKRQRLNPLPEVGFPGDICSTATFKREYDHKAGKYGPWIRDGTRFYKVTKRSSEWVMTGVECDLEHLTGRLGNWPAPNINHHEILDKWYFLGYYVMIRRDNQDDNTFRNTVHAEEFEEWFPKALQYQLSCTQLAGNAPKHLIFTIWGINDIIRGYFNMTFEDTPIKPPWKERS